MILPRSVSIFKLLNPIFGSTRHSPIVNFQTSSLCREKEYFVRDGRPNVNIATLGAPGHGKTTLTSSLTKVLSKEHGVPIKDIEDIDNSASEKENKQSQNATHLEMWTSKFRYAWTDLPGHTSYINNLINHLTHMDVVLLLVNANEGVCKETKEHYHIAKHFNIPLVKIVINKSVETDEETLDLVRMELEELDYDPDKLSIVDAINGLGLENFVMDLERNIQTFERKEHGHFLMAVEQAGMIPNRGTFCAGRILQGSLSVGDSLEAFYQGSSSKTNAKELEIFRKVTSTIQAGDRGGAFIKTKNLELKRGSILYNPKLNLPVSDKWDISISALPGQGTVDLKGDVVFYHSTNTDGKANISPCSVTHLDKIEVKIKLRYKIMANAGDPIVIRNNQRLLIGHLLKHN